MIAHSLLFARPQDAAGGDREEPPYFHDLRLDQVVASITRGREDYRLGPLFHAVLPTADAVAYRHEVVRDLSGSDVAAALTGFSSGIRAVLDRHAHPTHPIQKDLDFLASAGAYVEVVCRLAGDLRDAAVRSRGLCGLRDYLRAYLESPPFAALAQETGDLTDALAGLRYSLHVRGGRIRVGRAAGACDYGAELEAVLAPFDAGPGPDRPFLSAGPRPLTRVDVLVLEAVAELNAETFERVRMFRGEYAAFVDETLVAVAREAQFYLAFQDFANGLAGIGVRFCLPEVSARSKEMSAREAADLALADKIARDGGVLVRNDFALRGPERIMVVSGPNQGGKTTFARMIGQVHHLAAIGLPVPCGAAKVFLFDCLFTHFAEEERASGGHGKLEAELLRLHDLLERATPRSLVILNEMLSSTSAQDAAAIAGRVMERLVDLDLVCVCVTFLDELSRSGDTTVSVVGAVEDGAVRTFRFRRAPADGAAYAASIAARYGLTYPQLRERIRP
ncbi:MAG TPA: hypothetical protein VFH03_25015 [Actinoplanes sp.]|nr:hypothetical protein [Actinoplanes sp.]